MSRGMFLVFNFRANGEGQLVVSSFAVTGGQKAGNCWENKKYSNKSESRTSNKYNL